MSADRATVSVTVSCDRATAFSIFSEETDLWWCKGPRYRIAGRSPGVLRFEPGEGGKLVESFDTASGPQEFVTGRVIAWNPPQRIQFEWRGVNYAPGESTLVEVLFDETPTGTRVTVHHSGWAMLPPDHPVRHGKEDVEFIRNLGMWWAGLLTSLRERIASRVPS